MMQLPLQQWAMAPAGVALLKALEADTGVTRLVGGAVRDAILGLPVKDIDLATQLTPETVIARIKAAGLKAVPTGLAHGTVTAVGPGLSAEVTTLRRDMVTDGRHAIVDFTDDWQADASRRDFTLNALFATLPDGVITDFFDGLPDLAARRVRFIGAPLQRIAEDHLRILRFFRFSARYAAEVDKPGLAACTARANDLMALSRERIAGELRGILRVADPVPIMTLMITNGIWGPVLPEFKSDRLPMLARTVAAEAASGLAPDWRRRLAALLPADPAFAETLAARLRLSNADRVRLALAVVPLDRSDLCASAWAIGREAAVDRLLMAGDAPNAAIMAGWQRPRLPVQGRDILARGVLPGPAVAATLIRFERAWVAAGFPAEADAVAALLDRAMG